MKRALGTLVVIALVGVAIADHGSSAATPPHRRGAVAVLKTTPRLKRLLQAEITTLRLAQPSAPPALPALPRPLPRAPDAGVPCFVAGLSRCSEIPCREFATSPAVPRLSGSATRRTAPPTCRPAPHELVLVAAR